MNIVTSEDVSTSGESEPIVTGIREPRVINLNAVISYIETPLRSVVGEKIETTVLLNQDPSRVGAEPDKLEQVIMNLAINAKDAMPGGGDLIIETSNVQLDAEYARVHLNVEPGPHVLLAVTDTGCGMDEETVSRIFDPFFTTKTVGQGTGLGLYAVYGVVKQSGGTIWVYSEPGEGTTFKIYLPLVNQVGQTSEVAPRRPEWPEGSETILVVDDEELLRGLTSKILHRVGYKVLEARNGREALLIERKYRGQIDMLITDVVMPHMDGRQLFDRLAAASPTLAVIYTSGYTYEAIVRRGIRESEKHFIPKPFTASDLLSKVREVLDSTCGASIARLA